MSQRSVTHASFVIERTYPVPPLPQVLAHEGYHASFPEDKRDSNFSDPPYAFGAICGGR